MTLRAPLILVAVATTVGCTQQARTPVASTETEVADSCDVQVESSLREQAESMGSERLPVHVRHIRNQDAHALAQTLSRLPRRSRRGPEQAGVLGLNVHIVADRATNALVIAGEAADMEVIDELIALLDQSAPVLPSADEAIGEEPERRP